VRELGCPGIVIKNKKAFVDAGQCTGCSLCSQVCPFEAIECPKPPTREELLEIYANEKKPKAPSFPVSKSAASSDQTERNIIICGVGGQGTVLASRLLAATAMRLGVKIKTAETIGMAQRGGSVVSHIRIGEGNYSPMIGKYGADLIIGFEPAETVRNLAFLKPGGTVVTSIAPVVPVSALTGGQTYELDALLAFLKENVDNLKLIDARAAAREIGSEKIINVLLLGLAAESGLLGFTKEALTETIKILVPEKVLEINLKALSYRE
jgi:indolepyruvate ferredoxin oxidoreductase beta subunit